MTIIKQLERDRYFFLSHRWWYPGSVPSWRVALLHAVRAQVNPSMVFLYHPSGARPSSAPSKEEKRKHRGASPPVPGPRPEAAANALAQVPLERTQSRGQAWGGALKPSSGLSPGAAGPRAIGELASRTSHGARSSAHFADEDTELGELNQLGLPEITRLEVGRSFAGSHSKTWVLFTPSPRTPSLPWNRVHICSLVASRSTFPTARLPSAAAVFSWPSIGVEM